MVSLWVSLAQAQKNLGLDWKHFLAAVWFWGSLVLGSQSPLVRGKLRHPRPPQPMQRHQGVKLGPPRWFPSILP